MKRLVALTSILAAFSASILSSNAQTFTANLTVDQEPAPVGTRTGSGTGTFTLNGTSLDYTITFSGLSTPTTQGHIHGPTPSNRPPQPSFGVIHPFTFTTGTQAGTITGTWTGMTQLQIDDLNAGFMYANIHTTGNTGGEIRGAIVAVPEPSTYALLGSTALIGLATLRRKKA